MPPLLLLLGGLFSLPQLSLGLLQSESCLGAATTGLQGSKNHINIRTPQTAFSGIPRLLGLKARM